MGLNISLDFGNFKPYDWTNFYNVMRDIRDAHYRTDEKLEKILENRGKYVLPEGKYNDLTKAFWKDFDEAASRYYENANAYTMGELWNMNRRYSGEIAPINKMVEDYNATIDAMNKLDPSVIVGGKSTFNINDMLPGVRKPLETRDSRAIIATSQEAFKGLLNGMLANPETINLLGKYGLQFFAIKSGTPLSGQDAVNALLSYNHLDPNSNDTTTLNMREVGKLFENLYSQFSFSEGTAENSLIMNAIITGAIAGLQKPDYLYQKNGEYTTPVERANIAHTNASTASILQDAQHKREDRELLENILINKEIQSMRETFPDARMKVGDLSSLARRRLNAMGFNDDDGLPLDPKPVNNKSRNGEHTVNVEVPIPNNKTNTNTSTVSIITKKNNITNKTERRVVGPDGRELSEDLANTVYVHYLRNQGYSDAQIKDMLKQELVSPRKVNDYITSSKMLDDYAKQMQQREIEKEIRKSLELPKKEIKSEQKNTTNASRSSSNTRLAPTLSSNKPSNKPALNSLPLSSPSKKPIKKRDVAASNKLSNDLDI